MRSRSIRLASPCLWCRVGLVVAALVGLTLPIAVLTLPLRVGQAAFLDGLLANLAVWTAMLGFDLGRQIVTGLRYAALWSRRMTPRRSQGLVASHFVL